MPAPSSSYSSRTAVRWQLQLTADLKMILAAAATVPAVRQAITAAARGQDPPAEPQARPDSCVLQLPVQLPSP
jgi:hypothetical protein